MIHTPATRVQWTEGIIAETVENSYKQRLRKFIENEESEAIQLFSDEARTASNNGDWYGEHAGKWLVAACLAFRRTQDAELRGAIERVLNFLISQQESDGYLGTYAADAGCRLTHLDVSKARSWDIWIHAWILQGLNAAQREFGHEQAKRAAEKIGDLLIARFFDPADLLRVGNHSGLSSAVIIEPLARLTIQTKNRKYAQFAAQIVDSMEANGLPILSCVLDAAELGTGKSYQICWILNGLVALSQATENRKYLEAAAYWWQNISEHHLTPLGGPWGGIGTHKEVFNSKDFFSPEGMTETCSTASWMSLCRELFFQTGETKYAAAFDLSLHNALLGAIDANGADWCYFTFPNGRRNSTYHWACCKSSGAMGLEEAALMALTVTEKGVSINLTEPFEGTISFDSQPITIQVTQSKITVSLSTPQVFEIAVRVPEWSDLPSESGYSRITQEWKNGDTIELNFPMKLKITPKTVSLDHHGQEIVRSDYAFLSFGPYVYACGLIDGYKKQESLRLAQLFPESTFSLNEALAEDGIPAILYNQPARQPIIFRPYFQAGGRHDSAWRATWISVVWQ